MAVAASRPSHAPSGRFEHSTWNAALPGTRSPGRVRKLIRSFSSIARFTFCIISGMVCRSRSRPFRSSTIEATTDCMSSTWSRMSARCSRENLVTSRTIAASASNVASIDSCSSSSSSVASATSFVKSRTNASFSASAVVRVSRFSRFPTASSDTPFNESRVSARSCRPFAIVSPLPSSVSAPTSSSSLTGWALASLPARSSEMRRREASRSSNSTGERVRLSPSTDPLCSTGPES